MVYTQQLRDMILQRIQDKLKRFVGVNETLENRFTEWFQSLIVPPIPQIPPTQEEV